MFIEAPSLQEISPALKKYMAARLLYLFMIGRFGLYFSFMV